MTINDIVLLLGVGSLGTIITALIAGWLKRGDRQLDEAGLIRRELREQNTTLTARIDAVYAELDEWKRKYYDLQQSFAVLQAKDTGLQAQYVELQARYTDLQERYTKMAVDGDRMQEELSALHMQVDRLTGGQKQRRSTS